MIMMHGCPCPLASYTPFPTSPKWPIVYPVGRKNLQTQPYGQRLLYNNGQLQQYWKMLSYFKKQNSDD